MKKIAPLACTVLLLASFQPIFRGAPQEVQNVEARGAAAAKATLESKVRELLVLTGASDLGAQVMDSMIKSLENRQGLPEDFIATFREVADSEDLVELVVPIYVKHLDEPTLDSAIQFFKSPAGRKFTKSQPAIIEESMRVGQQWGQELVMEVLRSLEDR
jgi:hypothetical protein